MKKLSDISWNVTEEEYREDKALSYSTLARFEREGFNKLDKLFDKLETPSLTFGSAVDSIITGGQEEFDDRFIIAEFPTISDNLVLVTKTLFSRYNELYTNLTDIPDNILAEVGKECDFWANDKYVNHRVKLIKENCADLYNLMHISIGKTILDTATYNDVLATVDVLKNNESTRFYFAENNPFDGIERYYQLKFKATIDNIEYRCMADNIIVDYNNKVIIPTDLKTSSKPEWDFFKSFIDWRYDIQARLYWAIIRQNLDKDEYFKDFKLLDYRFIVVNRKTLCPLVWEFPYTKTVGTLTFGKDDRILCRNPFEIGKELNHYLSSRPIVPIGIELNKENNLATWLKTL